MLSLTLPIFAQSLMYTESESITCGNGACEKVSFPVKKWEEKAVEIAGKTYNFKVVDIIEKEYTDSKGNKHHSMNCIVAVNGEEMTSQEILEKYGFEPNIVPEPAVTPFVSFDVFETHVDGCQVPDCAFRVELDLHKKWNLVPIYFLLNEQQDEIQLEKGTCKLQDFLVIYGYSPVEKDYVKLHSYGKGANDLKNSIIDFKVADRTFVNTPFNSVWVYSINECELVAELSNTYKNLLLILEQGRSQGATSFASGWNFWVGSADMEGKSFDEMKGSCTIEKAYTFDASSQSWKTLTTPPGPATNFIFKATGACMFGFAETAPPELPE